MPPPSIYDSERLAAAYARKRPPVHREIIAAAKVALARLDIPRAARALDVGCGAGLSTAALAPLAQDLFGLEPVATMLRHHREIAPRAHFVVGRAEQLPFGSGAFELLSAAGALNYARHDVVLPEVARVLTHRGGLLIYDFSGGRRLAADARLDEWFAAFETRYPYPPGYAMDVKSLPFETVGMRLEYYEAIEVAIPMTGEAYLAYVLSETNVELALSYGVVEETVAAWCMSTLGDIFGDGARDVLFDAYAGYARKLS